MVMCEKGAPHARTSRQFDLSSVTRMSTRNMLRKNVFNHSDVRGIKGEMFDP